MDYAALRDLMVNLRSMIFMRKMKGVTMFNPMEALGIIPPGEQEEEDVERVLELWGT